MKHIGKKMTAVVAGLGALTLVAMPSLAGAHGGAGSEQAAAAVRRAHMTQGHGGAWGAQPCPMGTKSQRMMGPGMMGPGMMGPGMMGPGMAPGMMGPGKMGPGMGGHAMMGPGKGAQGMMGPGFGIGRGHGMRVVPRADLSTDDVRHFFKDRLAAHGSKRLKLGEVKEADDGSIVADIVTLEDSLVQRFEVDRHTGRVRQVE